MPNKHFKFFQGDEFNTFNKMQDEVCEFGGVEAYYLPRTLQKTDNLFGEDILSKFEKRYICTLLIENVGGWEGEGDLFTKFGITITDEITFKVEKNRFTVYTTMEKPLEGDLIYLPFANQTFEISFIETDDPFLPLGDKGLWTIKCKVFEYSHEEMDTKIEEVDALEDLKDAPDLEDNTEIDAEEAADDIVDFSEDAPFGD